MYIQCSVHGIGESLEALLFRLPWCIYNFKLLVGRSVLQGISLSRTEHDNQEEDNQEEDIIRPPVQPFMSDVNMDTDDYPFCANNGHVESNKNDVSICDIRRMYQDNIVSIVKGTVITAKLRVHVHVHCSSYMYASRCYQP